MLQFQKVIRWIIGGGFLLNQIGTHWFVKHWTSWAMTNTWMNFVKNQNKAHLNHTILWSEILLFFIFLIQTSHATSYCYHFKFNYHSKTFVSLTYKNVICSDRNQGHLYMSYFTFMQCETPGFLIATFIYQLCH